MKNIELIAVDGEHLMCDNPECDHIHYDKDLHYNDLEKWIDFPCPKCGESLLTREDYEGSLLLQDYVKMMNSLSEEELEELKKQSKELLTEERIEQLKSIGLDVKFDENGEIDENQRVVANVHVHKGININFKPDGT